jgi:hypothetical protein
VRILLIAAFVVLVTACNLGDVRSEYVVTSKGVMQGWVSCKLGMLLSGDNINIRDENDKPITCTGTVRLTKNEAENY